MVHGNILIDIAPAIIVVIFIVVMGIIISRLMKEINQWYVDENSPRLSAKAVVKSKYSKVNHYHYHYGDHTTHNTNIFYYVTLEIETGERMNFNVNRNEYSQLTEGDLGIVTFQGTRYLGFIQTKEMEETS